MHAGRLAQLLEAKALLALPRLLMERMDWVPKESTLRKAWGLGRPGGMRPRGGAGGGLPPGGREEEAALLVPVPAVPSPVVLMVGGPTVDRVPCVEAPRVEAPRVEAPRVEAPTVLRVEAPTVFSSSVSLGKKRGVFWTEMLRGRGSCSPPLTPMAASAGKISSPSEGRRAMGWTIGTSTLEEPLVRQDSSSSSLSSSASSNGASTMSR